MLHYLIFPEEDANSLDINIQINRIRDLSQRLNHWLSEWNVQHWTSSMGQRSEGNRSCEPSNLQLDTVQPLSS